MPGKTKRAATTKMELTIPGPVKESMMGTLTEATERLVSVLNAVKMATESAEQLAEPVPAELGAEVKAICDLLWGMMEAYPSPKAMADGTVVTMTDEQVAGLLSKLGSEAADKLAVIGRLITMVADHSDPMSLAQFAQNALGGVAKSLGDAKAEGPLAETVSALAKGADALLAEVLAAPLSDDEAQDAIVVQAESAVAEVAKVGAKMSAARLTKLQAAFEMLSKLLTELGVQKSDSTPPGDPAAEPLAEPVVASPTDAPPVADPPAAEPAAEPATEPVAEPVAAAPALDAETVAKMIAEAVETSTAALLAKLAPAAPQPVVKRASAPVAPASAPVDGPPVPVAPSVSTKRKDPRAGRSWVA